MAGKPPAKDPSFRSVSGTCATTDVNELRRVLQSGQRCAAVVTTVDAGWIGKPKVSSFLMLVIEVELVTGREETVVIDGVTGRMMAVVNEVEFCNVLIVEIEVSCRVSVIFEVNVDVSSDAVDVVCKNVLGEKELLVEDEVTVVEITVLSVATAFGLERVIVELAGNNDVLVRLVRTCVML